MTAAAAGSDVVRLRPIVPVPFPGIPEQAGSAIVTAK